MKIIKNLLLSILIISLALLFINLKLMKPETSPANTTSYDFEYQYKGQTLHYVITRFDRVNTPGTVKVVGIDNDVDQAQLYIPSTLTYTGSTYKVTEIGDDAFNKCDYLTMIQLPDSITKIGDSAFASIPINSINLSEGLTAIGNYSFYNTAIQSFNLPQSLKTIGKGSFESCPSLTSIVIPNGITKIDDDAFMNCNNLTSVQLPDSITIIERGAFSNCNKFIQINVPSSLVRIDQSAFPEDSNLLAQFTTGNVQVNYTYDDVYDHNSSFQGRYRILTSPTATTMGTVACCGPINQYGNPPTITIPRTVSDYGNTYLVTEINDGAFENIKNITSIKLPDSITYIGDNAFYWTDLIGINIPNSVTHIGSYAFMYTEIKSITIPNSVTSIGEGAFSSCRLNKITLSNSMTNLNDYLFYDCNLLTHVTIPNSVKTIGRYAFSESSIYDISIPNSVTKIDDEAFQGCYFLRNVTIPDSVTDIAPAVFANCRQLVSVKLPKNLSIIENSMFIWCERLQSAQIPSTVTTIGRSAYGECSLLEGVTLPNSLIKIGYNSFENCSNLNKLTIPKNISSIGTKAFSGIKHIFTVYKGTYGETYLKTNKITYQYVGTTSTKVPIDKLVMKQKDLVYSVGDKVNLSVSILPSNTTDSKTITWSTSNPYHATVDSKGTVTLKDVGYVTITASTGNKKCVCDFTVKPAIPVIKAVSNGYNSIKLTWKYTPGIYYQIYRSTSLSGTFKQVAEVWNIGTYIDKNLDNNYTYYYKAYAYSYFSPTISTSKYSKISSAYPILSKPDKISASAQAKGGIKITWNKSNGADGYMVYRANSTKGKYTLLKAVKTLSYVDSSSKKSKTYYYKVAAYNDMQKKKVFSAYTKVVKAKSK